VRVEAVEPDEAMLVEALPFPDAHFDSAVVTLVLCSVCDPERDLREIWRVLKPGGTLLLLEHVRAQGRIAAWVQDALVPLSTRCMGNCHWNRDTLHTVLQTGFQAMQVQKKSGGLQPMLSLSASRPQTQEESDEGQ
jgi:ubiquinone/menaquinone biosynthesis C-methylase UbiE